MLPRYPIPWTIVVRLLPAIFFRKQRDFNHDARACLARLRPSMQVIGREYIPASGPCLLTVNHYTRPGFPAWWFVLGISAVVPCQIHWLITAAWTFQDPLRKRLLTPVTRWVFRRIARTYSFATMPPMPPDPSETEARALSVRQTLQYVRKTGQPIIGMAPEGRDSLDHGLQNLPPGAGRFMLHLSRLGLPIVPIGAFEADGAFFLRFGTKYHLQVPPGLSASENDRQVSQIVMGQIANLLPPTLQGEFRTPELDLLSGSNISAP